MAVCIYYVLRYPQPRSCPTSSFQGSLLLQTRSHWWKKEKIRPWLHCQPQLVNLELGHCQEGRRRNWRSHRQANPTKIGSKESQQHQKALCFGQIRSSHSIRYQKGCWKERKDKICRTKNSTSYHSSHPSTQTQKNGWQGTIFYFTRKNHDDFMAHDFYECTLLGDGMCALVVELTWVCPARLCDVGDHQSLLVMSWPWTPNIKRANRLSQAHSMRIVGFLFWRRSHEGKPCWAHFLNFSSMRSIFDCWPSGSWFFFSEITCWTSPEGRSWVQKAPCSTC